MSERSAASQARFHRAFPYLVRVSLESGLDWTGAHHHIIDWCRENCIGRFAVVRNPAFVGCGGYDLKTSIHPFRFANDRDATLFKMFWGAEG